MNKSSAAEHLTIIRTGRCGSHKTEVCFGMPGQFVARAVNSRRTAASAIFEPIGHYVSDDNKGVEITLSLSRLPREIAAGELGEIDLSQRGIVVASRRDAAKDEWKSSCLILKEEERKRIGRLKIVRFGKTAFGLEVTAPVTCNPIIANACCQVSDSLVVCSEPPEELAESLQTHTIGIENQIRFDLPKSWRQEQVPGESTTSSITLHGGSAKDCEASEASIRCELLNTKPNQSAVHVVEGFKRSLEAQGMRLGGAPLFPVPAPVACDRAFVYCPRVACEGEPNRTAGMLVCERKGQCLLLSSVSLDRQESLVWWSVNRRAFEIAQRSLEWN